MNIEADYGSPGPGPGPGPGLGPGPGPGPILGPISSGTGKLRQWLIEQVDGGSYPGLVWEDAQRSVFRIPWKHAGKQDYNRDEDAALFKFPGVLTTRCVVHGGPQFHLGPLSFTGGRSPAAVCPQAWALFKGKFREGIDKPEPPTWKTRLRCALNKSNDFEELIPAYMAAPECGWREYIQEQASHPELPFPQGPYPPRGLAWQGPPVDNGYEVKGSFYSYSQADVQPCSFNLEPSMRPDALSDLRLHVCVFFRDALLTEVTVSNPEGCHLAPCALERPCLPPGAPELVPLPPDSLSDPGSPGGEERPPAAVTATMERGVLLWMRPDGVYGRRLCRQSVFWQGRGFPHADKLHKMERDVTCRLLHTQEFLSGQDPHGTIAEVQGRRKPNTLTLSHLLLPELQSYGLHGRPPPPFQALLSFGDESEDPQGPRRPLTVQVEPLFARQLYYYAQQPGGPCYRGY
ncbi:hypothetical protein CRUP_033462 [Coryphaenoides rupestris]|nr:hypothetical protein CRUP_033462 [Coryphaenoides rupestris]